MNRPESAAGRWGATESAGQTTSTDSLAEHAEVGKQAALTRLGEILAAMPKNTGAKGIGPIAVPDENRNQPPTLADLGIDKKVSVSTGLTQSSFGRVTS